MSVDIILKDIEWDGVNKIRVPLEGGGTQDFSIGGGSANLQTKSKTYTPSTSQQTDTITPDNGYDGLDEVDITVDAMPSGSALPPSSILGTDAQISVQGQHVLQFAKSVPVTPVVTAGYISAGTEANTSVVLRAAVSTKGAATYTPTTTDQTIARGTYITGAQTISGDANLVAGNIKSGTSIFGVTGTYSGGTPTLQTKSKTYTPTTSQQTDTITPDTGYDGLDEVDITINAVPTGTVTAPSDITVGQATVLQRLSNTVLTVYKENVSVTPNVTQAGYISSGTAGNCTVTVGTNIPVKTAATFYPSTTDQTIRDNTYIASTQTIKAVTTNNIIASNIKSGVTVEVGDADDPDRVLSVTGTYSGGTSTCDTKTMTNSDSQATSIQFTGLSGEPRWFFVRCTSQLTRSSSYSYYFVTDIRYNGTNHDGNYYRRSNGTYYNDTSHYSHTYSNGTLTVSSSANRGSAGGSFYNGNYELVYIY